MGNIGTGELFVVLLVALLVFGPNRLPEIARNLGKAVRAFQREATKATSVLRDAIEEEPPPAPAPPPAPSPALPPEFPRDLEDT